MTVSDPIALFLEDRERARAAAEPWDAASCALATTDEAGRPSVRFVLAKEVDAEGFWFYTNYESRKGHELSRRPEAALAFHFDRITLQYRVEGTVVRAPAARSDAYFASRPRVSQLGAWASEQSQPLPDDHTLPDRLRALEEKYPGEVPRPPHWGGFCLRPARIERWTEGAFRLHRRQLFTWSDNRWISQEIQP